MAQRTLNIELSLRIVPGMPIIRIQRQKGYILRKLAPFTAKRGFQGCEVIQLTGLNKARRKSVHAAIREGLPDVVYDTVGPDHGRILRLYTRSACKTVLLHPSSPLAALPQALQQAIAQGLPGGLGSPSALPRPRAEPRHLLRQVHSLCRPAPLF